MYNILINGILNLKNQQKYQEKYKALKVDVVSLLYNLIFIQP